jgi:hypothetical protein
VIKEYVAAAQNSEPRRNCSLFEVLARNGVGMRSESLKMGNSWSVGSLAHGVRDISPGPKVQRGLDSANPERNDTVSGSVGSSAGRWYVPVVRHDPCRRF